MANENKFKLANYGNPQLTKDAGSLSFFTPQGNPDDVDRIVDAQNSVSFGKLKRVPGINVLTYMITPGLSTDGTSALNMASKKLYTFVRHTNSGSRNYDSPDLMNFAFSGVSLFTFIAQAQRAYGVIRNWKGKNRYFGKYLTQALGWDYNDLEGKLADFRAAINLAVAKLNAIKIPSAWPFWGKNWILNTVLLKDGDIDRSQVYAYRCNVIWKYNETGTYVGSLTPQFLYGNTETNLIDLADFNMYIDTIVNAFVASEDINIMSGDIMKAYGAENCLELPYLTEDYIIDPVYNREMLEIIHNTTPYEISKTYSSNAGCIIYQNSDNALIFDPIIPLAEVGYDTGLDDHGDPVAVEGTSVDNEYIDFFRDEIVPEDVVSTSIMTVLPKIHRGQDGHYDFGEFTSFGTEVAVKSQIFCINDAGNGFETGVIAAQRRYFYVSNSVSTPSEAVLASLLSRFDWHNRCTIFKLPNSFDEYPADCSTFALYDLYNYTVVTSSDLLKLHDVHVLGGFGLLE